MTRPSHRPRIHRSHTIRRYHPPHEMISIDKYIEAERPQISAASLIELASFSKEIASKLTTEQARQHHDLQVYTNCLLRLLASETVKQAKDPLPPALGEAGVAARYLLQTFDLIPDSLPEIGLTDDARIMARVFERNPELANW